MPKLGAQHMQGDLQGVRILIVEDDFIIASEEEIWLEEIGCEVLGPLPSVPAALAALTADLPDGAVLDIDVRGTTVYPVAQFLADQNIPFLFVSGSDPDSIDQNFKSVPRLMKPVREHQLQSAVMQLFHEPSQ